MAERTTLQEVGGYERVTNGIRIVASPMHIPDQSNPTEGVFAFSYTILIQNLSPHTAQLVERSWLIYSAGRKFADVVGPGVVGKTPILKSGQSFEYSSSAVIDAPVGTMEGRYTFLADDGARFDVEIPRFDLLYPVVIH